jgi:hypothetical protein
MRARNSENGNKGGTVGILMNMWHEDRRAECSFFESSTRPDSRVGCEDNSEERQEESVAADRDCRLDISVERDGWTCLGSNQPLADGHLSFSPRVLVDCHQFPSAPKTTGSNLGLASTPTGFSFGFFTRE